MRLRIFLSLKYSISLKIKTNNFKGFQMQIKIRLVTGENQKSSHLGKVQRCNKIQTEIGEN